MKKTLALLLVASLLLAGCTELTDAVDDNGDEDFQSVIKEIRRKDHTIKNPKFKVFDILTLDEFDSGGHML